MKNKYFDLLEVVMDEYEKEGYEPELLGEDLVTVTQWSEYGFYYTKDGQRKCRQDRQAAYKRLISCEHGHELLRMEKKMVQQGHFHVNLLFPGAPDAPRRPNGIEVVRSSFASL